MSKLFGAKIEETIRLLAREIPHAEKLIKPTLFHCVRVGVYLYENKYSEDIVLAGLLHDIIEDTTVTEDGLKAQYNDNVVGIVMANTKVKGGSDPDQVEAIVKKCAKYGPDALIIKMADVLDNYKYYEQIGTKDEIERANKYAKTIFNYLPNNFDTLVLRDLRAIHTRNSS